MESWYYVSPHFICDIEYDFTGLNYEPVNYNAATGQVEGPDEFPSPSAAGSDPSQQRALRRARIILVEPGRVKKRK